MSAALDRALESAQHGHAAGSFWEVLTQMALLGVLLHLLLILLFMLAGVDGMAWANAGSAVLLAICARLLRERRNATAMTLIVFETIVHAIAATVIVGWESGFHYYVIPLLGCVVANESRSNWSKGALIAAVGFFYLLLDAFARQHPPLQPIDDTSLGLLRTFNIGVTFAVLGFTSLSYQWQVKRAEQSLRTRASTDPLTGLYNRSRLLEIARYEQTQRKRRGGSMSMLLADIDWFKAINDRHGHAGGDQVLCAVATALRSSVREQDCVARWGGEEFLILLPDTRLAAAAEVAERIRQCIAGLRIAGAGSEALQCTLTLGVSEYRNGEDIERCISRADAALYRGKAAGRNRVVRADDEPAADAPTPAPAIPQTAPVAGSPRIDLG